MPSLYHGIVWIMTAFLLWTTVPSTEGWILDICTFVESGYFSEPLRCWHALWAVFQKTEQHIVKRLRKRNTCSGNDWRIGIANFWRIFCCCCNGRYAWPWLEWEYLTGRQQLVIHNISSLFFLFNFSQRSVDQEVFQGHIAFLTRDQTENGIATTKL